MLSVPVVLVVLVLGCDVQDEVHVALDDRTIYNTQGSMQMMEEARSCGAGGLLGSISVYERGGGKCQKALEKMAEWWNVSRVVQSPGGSLKR